MDIMEIHISMGAQLSATLVNTHMAIYVYNVQLVIIRIPAWQLTASPAQLELILMLLVSIVQVDACHAILEGMRL